MPEHISLAVNERLSRGRRHPERAPRHRGEFQRDRDRVVHSAAFRRLEYKTQVFVNHEGDMFRTRLTHSIEVAQIARTIARALGLNEDLAEAIALAHDLGHTPFGHAGQDALDRAMKDYGGFEHNLQSLRIVDRLEERYAQFDGLNLTFETREGILKHCSPEDARRLGAVASRFLDGGHPPLEAQVANLADEIAYNNHDVDDGLRAELLEIDALREVEMFRRQHDAVVSRWPDLAPRRVVHETVRRIIDFEVSDLLEATARSIEASGVTSVDEVREHPRPLVRFSDEVHAEHRALKHFLHRMLYRHHRVQAMSVQSRRIVRELFDTFFDDVRTLPGDVQARLGRMRARSGEAGAARAVADYLSGMTDRFAMSEHRRLLGASART